MTVKFLKLIEEVELCNHCCNDLPLIPRPVFQISQTAKLLITSQAPGLKAHDSGIPFNDASGNHLREWLGLSKDEFYDSSRVAILPMALCYPGRSNGGDMPPRKECASLWRNKLISEMPYIELTLLVGSYAHVHELGEGKVSLRVSQYQDYLPHYFSLPHPSWRSRIWMKKNQWFENDVLPLLQKRVRKIMDEIP